MKALILAAAASALVAGAAGSAAAYPDNGVNGYDNRSNYDGRSNNGWTQDRSRGRYDSNSHHGWAQDRGDGHQWRRGERMGYNDWSSAQPVDYRQHHLRHPPRGYEWRQSNGRYVMAAVATGVIASIMMNSDRY